MQILETGPFSIGELLSRIERDAGRKLDDEVQADVRDLVERLDALGLIAPVRP